MNILVGEGALTISTGDESYQEASLDITACPYPNSFCLSFV